MFRSISAEPEGVSLDVYPRCKQICSFASTSLITLGIKLQENVVALGTYTLTFYLPGRLLTFGISFVSI